MYRSGFPVFVDLNMTRADVNLPVARHAPSMSAAILMHIDGRYPGAHFAFHMNALIL